MLNSSMKGLNNENLAMINVRFEDLKKLWKTLKVGLVEDLTTFSQFGKAMVKGSRNLHFSFNHADPSFISKLTISLLTRQAQISQIMNKSVDEPLRALAKDVEAYEEKLEQIRLQAFDLINESIKQLVLSKTNHAKERANYEKICKETEATITDKKKPSSDPLVYYNMTHQRKSKVKIADALKNLRTAEQHVQDALELYNVRQQSLSVSLGESMRIFKDSLRTLFGNMIENVKKHNKIVDGLLKKEVAEFESNGSLSSIDGFALPSDMEEQQYIESRKQPQYELQSADQSAKGDNNTPVKDQKDLKGKYLELQARLIENPEDLSDFEMSEYFDIVQKHYEVALAVFEERHKVIRGLRSYMQDLSNLCSAIEKIFQKLSKSSISQSCSTMLGKKLGSTVDPLFEGFGAFAAIFQQFSAFINMKAPLLDSLLNDQKEQLKTFQVGFSKVFKDSSVVRTALVSAGLQQDRLRRKISEINEKDANDDRLPILRNELDNTKKHRESLLQDLRKQTVEEAKRISKIFEEYRAQEQTKFSDFSHVIKGFLAQEFLFFKGLAEGFTKIDNSLQFEKTADEEIAQAIEQDEPLTGLFKFIETNMNHDRTVNESESPKRKSVGFKKLYVPPVDVEDDEGAKSGEDEDDDQDKGEDVENEKKLAKRFGLRTNDKYIESFTCGVEQKILRQGRMYLYNTAVCFSTSKILGDFALSIPVSDITKIEKKTMSLVFDTALTITTKNGDIKFLSFFYRDKAYNLIASLKKESNLSKDASLITSPEKSTVSGSEGSAKKDSKSEFAIRLEAQVIEQSKKEKNEDIVLERKAGNLEAEEESENKEEVRRKSLVLTEDEHVGLNKSKEKESDAERSRANSVERPNGDGKNTPSDRSANVSIRLDNLSEDGEDQVPHIETKKSKFSTAHLLATKMSSPLALSYNLKPKGFLNVETGAENESLSGVEAGSSNAESQISSKEASATGNKEAEVIIIPTETEKVNVSEVKTDKVSEEKKQDQNITIVQDNVPKVAINTEKDVSKSASEKPNEIKVKPVVEIKTIQPEEKVIKRRDSEEVLREQQELEEAKEKKRFKAIIEQRKTKVRKMLLGDENYQTVVVQEVLPCTALDVYAAAFCDKKIVHKGKPYDCFWSLVKAEAGDTDVKFVKWTPHVPFDGIYSNKESLECLKKVAEGAEKSLRDFSYTHPVKGGGPFVPKECHIEEKQIGYWISPDEFEMQIQVFTSKVPMSDTFVVHNSFRAKDLPGGKCEFVWKLGVEFVKSTFFKGKITSTSKEENATYATKVFMPLMKEHIAIHLKEKAHEIKKREAKKESEKESAHQAKVQKHAAALHKAQAEAEVEAKKQEGEKPVLDAKQEEMSPIKEEEEASPEKVRDITVKEETTMEETKAEEEQNKDIMDAKSTEEEKSMVESPEETGSMRRDVGDLLGSGVTVREGFEEDFAKFVKASEKDRVEMKKEILGMKNLIMVLIAMNCFLILLLFFRG